MFQTILLWVGGLGIGIFAWLLMELYTPDWVSDRVLAIIAVIVWVVVVWFQQTSGAPLGGFLVVSGICWFLDLLAGLSIFVIVGGDD